MMLRQQREAAEAAAQDEEEGMIGMAVTSDDVGARDDDDDDEAGPSTGMLEVKPILPRKSSKRKSKEGSASGGGYTSMPFLSVDDEDDLGQSGSATSSLVHPPPHAGRDDDRPDSVGEVNSGRVGAVMRDERGDVRGSTAELVRGGSESSRGA